MIIIKCGTDKQIHIAADRLDPIRLDGLDAHRAILAGKDLTGSGLIGANLRGAELAGGALTDADFTDAGLMTADLRKACLRNSKLSGALYDDSTSWPEGFAPSEFGAIKICARSEYPSSE